MRKTREGEGRNKTKYKKREGWRKIIWILNKERCREIHKIVSIKSEFEERKRERERERERMTEKESLKENNRTRGVAEQLI